MQYSIINYSHHAIHYISMTYVFYNWNFVPLPTEVFFFLCLKYQDIKPITGQQPQPSEDRCLSFQSSSINHLDPIFMNEYE